MQDALHLAKRGLGKTHPNPSVGCVIVKDGEVRERMMLEWCSSVSVGAQMVLNCCV